MGHVVLGCALRASSAADAQAVLLYQPGAGDGVHPVGLLPGLAVVAQPAAGEDVVELLGSGLVVGQAPSVVLVIIAEGGVRAVFGVAVQQGLGGQLDVLVGIHQLVVAGVGRHGLEAHLGGEVHLGLAGLSALGGDDDDAVGGTRAVDGGGGGVLQHGDALDVTGVERRQRRHFLSLGGTHAQGIGKVGDAVHHVERLCARVQRVAATDINGGRSARLSGADGHLQARHRSLQRLDGVGVVLGGDGLAAQRGGRAREGCLAGDAVAGDHHFLQQLGIGLQHDVHGARLNVHFLRHHADVRHLQALGEARHIADGKLSVDVGNGAKLGALYQYRCSHNRPAVFVGSHYSRHCRRLGCYQTDSCEQDGQQQQDSSFHKFSLNK